MADRELAAQALQALFREGLRDEAELAQDGQPPAVRDRDPGRFLASMLQGVEPEGGEPRDVALGGANAEDAAHQP